MDTMVSSTATAFMVAHHTRRRINNSVDTCLNRSGSKCIVEKDEANCSNVTVFKETLGLTKE